MKKIPYPLYLAIFLGVLGIIAAALLAGVNVLTAPKIKEQIQRELERKLAAVEVISPEELETKLDAGVINAYKGKSKDGQDVFVFNVESANSFVTNNVLVVIEASSGKILNLVVSQPATTPGIVDKSEFEDNFFGIKDATVSDYDGKFIIVSGATVSSKSIKECIRLAFTQFEKVKGA